MMLLYLTEDELRALYYMVDGYFFEFTYQYSPYVTKFEQQQLHDKLKKEIEYYDTSEQKD